MTKQQVPFKSSRSKHDSYYDLHEDWDLIDASFTTQYGIRLRQNLDMTWNEFKTLLSGLGEDTPLGRIVQIRATKDSDVIKQFNSHQRKIYNDWQGRKIDELIKDEKKLDGIMKDLENALAQQFGSK